MKLLIDEQLPPLLARVLRAHGFDAAHGSDFGLTGQSDAAVWGTACRDGWAVVTKDADYARRLAEPPPHCPVIWVRIGNSRNRGLIDLVLRDGPSALAAIDEGAMLVEIR